jgi:hypothetical protein
MHLSINSEGSNWLGLFACGPLLPLAWIIAAASAPDKQQLLVLVLLLLLLLLLELKLHTKVTNMILHVC